MEMSIREFVRQFNEGAFNSPDLKTQCRAGWFDWFCQDRSLARKTQDLGKFVKQLKDSEKIDMVRDYVFFVNRCPLCYPLYDSVKICRRKDGMVKYCIDFNDQSIKERYNATVAIYGRENGFVVPLFTGNRREAVKWLNGEN